MRSLLKIFIALSIIVGQANAQSAYRFKFNDGPFSNWFIGAGVGPQVYFGDHDRQADLQDRISTGYQLYVGNWFTPDIGARISADGYKVKGLTQALAGHDVHSTGELYDAQDQLYKQEFNYYKVHADVMFNIMNYFYSYQADRFYSFIPYAGIGVMSVVDEPKATRLSFNLGASNDFRINDNFNIVIDVRGNLVGDGMDGEYGGRKFEGMFNSTIGLKYTFN
ncbi:hypothetical protein [Sphingobacterium hungaricum]|uniref:Outer membrane protein beta-barrel domain-containing protein n=1 Tax=Sphingobacterium hungaricum TaxID=2082723 RepID=A0A928UVN4_9SPHI|nr:hypothetical protein [Sphingobacterium hungaricum]MBE8712371.1 hypothetical protein [Sphingobacterium hungaricum]